MRTLRTLLEEFAAELGVLVAAAGFGAFLVVGTGCGMFFVGGECDCSDQPVSPTEAGEFVVDTRYSDPHPVDGAVVSFDGNRVTIDYEFGGSAVSVEYVVTDVVQDFR